MRKGSTPPLLDPPLAADCLRSNLSRVLATWEERARRDLPVAAGQESLALLDSLPAMLEQLVHILADPSPRDALRREQDVLAIEHGTQRARVEAFTLEHIVHEYQILRQVLFEILEERAPMTRDVRDVLLDAVQFGARNAVREFALLRDAERARSQEHLRALNEDLERSVEARTADLSHSEERFRLFVDAVKDYAIFTLDPNGYISSWNAGCRRVKGYTDDEAIGRHYSMLYPPDGRRRDEPMSHLRTAASEGRFRGEGLRIRKNGDLFVADVSITPMYRGDELIGFGKVVQDLTERNLLMQERDLTRTDLDRMRVEAEYRERFVATLTHDLRSPLSAAKYAAELIVRRPEEHDEVRRWAQRISAVIDQTNRMISDLLDATRIHAGEPLPMKFAECDAHQIALEVRDDLSTRHGDRFVVQADGPTVGVWSPEGLRRVLDNLLSNAIKYGEAGSPITVRLRRVEDRLLLSVHNNGTIIPVEEQAKLFQPFHRTRLAQASESGGWGLGLTLVKGIVEAHHGMVKVESYPKDGTTFTVDLPVDARARAEAGVVSER